MPCTKTEEDPPRAIGCYVNFCPECEDKADDYLEVTSFIYPPKPKGLNNTQQSLFQLEGKVWKT